ncbi:rho guanine nucleotide exchange factor 6 isoform X1 [Pogonomyrmex barbatus]|uniref:Rho guanine nucleotide exchange factor 6 isoform X1 n=1 Tax=Pogonomyrmex barbatus TaxID=144034 RepID=A0A8N1SAD8_9HYME|nr:rho guanine nucleotide exchange factor 6 isoform X1 [Pogonomyrmex barbatus]XP_025075105.1 rho guanine nucleotide exchange factor 6 isoform X1 [Pogonomyrmex barbatus]XP_025075106.1 rho guanine nucleotide exchange factor 6 isoform X1 [Pogonomyrmex barbatus]XP_025075108.1 rho guanine nucleotide exchange factor 6 isoform X1 [Pogonomyrmex barbatus]
MSKLEPPKFVIALFSFKGKNNDELCFKKGDVITITQVDDEGWWEGTLHDKTGWFPSNYVKEYRIPDGGHASIKTSPERNPQESPVHQKLNRDIVLKDIVDSERVNVAELQGLMNNFLQPLETSNILKKEEYKQLLGNIHEILETHQCLLANLEGTVQGLSARVGNLFLTIAPRLKSIHTTYCNNHPQAVCILDRYRDELNEFMERSGAISPGILVLTTGLSKPFRRLDKYSAMLQELERHTEKNHPDRGDTQRSITVYREIAEHCASIRKQRELALQVLTSGIKGWEGEELNSLGEIIHVGSVTLATGVDRRDRYFVLFPTTLLVLSTSNRMSSFIYEGKLPLTGINVTGIEDTDEIRNALEITGPMIESIVVLCATKEERQHWIDLLIQEQCTSLLKSPTMPRVSCHHPPYARLSRYFAKLVRRKIIYPELMKKLLYIQFVLKPDLSNVKMRKCNVTYTIFPTSEESESDASTQSNMQEEPRVLRKSSLILDVRYVTDNTDLSTVGIASTSSLTNFAPRVDCDNRCTFETSKSLPAGATMSHVLPNVPLALSKSYTSNLQARNEFYREHLEIPCDRDHDDLTMSYKYLKALEPYPENLNAPVPYSTTQIDNCDSIGGEFRETCVNISLRSSDSGMAESYHLRSSEINSCYKSYASSHTKYIDPVRTSHSESDNDENKFEHQCICTSPFGSTPRDSAHSLASSKNIDDCTNLTKSNAVDSDINDDPNNSRKKFQETVLIHPLINYGNVQGKRYTQPIPYAHQCVIKKVGRRVVRPIQPIMEEHDEPTNQVYSSGLYAHWWLKKSIPIFGCTEQADEQSAEREASTTGNGTLYISRD